MGLSLLVSVETTLLLSVAALYIVQCPFNKVEESFNTQAVHDIINIFPSNIPLLTSKNSSSEIAIRSQLPWDHTQYPGPVARTFLGALMVGLPMRLAKQLILNGFMQDEFDVKDDHDFTAQFILQIGSRFALSSFIVVSMSVLLNAIQRRYGLAYRLCFLIITVSQFHYIFYASRFLPNSYANIFANLVFASWISRQYSKSIIYIAICVLIFRFDTAIFFGWLLIDGLFIRRLLSLKRVLSVGIPTGLIAIIAGASVDLLFWGKLVWPELDMLYFNVWLNKSHHWGTEPYFWYIYSCIPRIMLASAPLLMLAEHKFTRDYLIPVLAFIFTYSLLPHKELRFILFITPLLNLCASSGLMNVYHYLNVLFVHLGERVKQRSPKVSTSPSKRKKAASSVSTSSSRHSRKRSRIAVAAFTLVIVGMFVANLFASFILARISTHNYPGGEAAISLGVTKELLDMAKESMSSTIGAKHFRSEVAVYVDNLAAQTGFSRFVQVNGVFYAKSLKLDDQTFVNAYKLIYAVLEPQEINSFLVDHCASSERQLSSDSWRKTNNEIKCKIPNQPEMYCSMIDTVESFYSVNIGALLRKVRQVDSLGAVAKVFDDKGFIKTRAALHIIRCSVRSKTNPFS